MFAKNLKWIGKDLRKYEDISREDLLRNCITNKLAETLKRYNKEIDLNSDYLLTRSSTKVLKALTKIQKKQDKEVLEESSEEEEEEFEPPLKEIDLNE